ncbi:helix-turn-helix domain-containing protein [Mucilaginibacter psychrotolerans]|uniref:AraC family transcriptional regulator n=1 Tax=Mucilaginibacter psychrotolerans TaxID=1524096 RepID=A0A4Y8SE95_9SPHI|nr:helix-turn-helix domain-containing protein [Mucilaginibacter psychrotolerans]TFF36716.1 AraC family transcriptional regulator [Mucilaginibacter psychrotolerans]
MQHQEFEPPPELSEAIKCFWHNKGYFDQQPTNFEVIPDGYAEIIFHFGNGCSILKNGTLHPLPSPFMMGLLNAPVVFYTQGLLQIIGIRCYPWAVFDLLGLKASNHGLQTFEHSIAQLNPTLKACIDAGEIHEATEMVKKYFLDAQPEIQPNSMLAKAGLAMRQANGSLPVSQVAEAAHATVRTLERGFKQSSGHTVKDVSALIRFEQVRNHLWLYPKANLAGLAHELGYTDQSHLSREFKRYSGTTPAAFARNTQKSKQALGSDFVAFVQA